MSMSNRRVWAVVRVVLGTVYAVSAVAQPKTFKFDFGSGAVAEGMTQVLPEMIYSESAGFGLERGALVKAVDRAGGDPVTRDFGTAGGPFFFSVAVPGEGNYRVTVMLGDREAESVTTIKAELRRRMVEAIPTAPGPFQTVSFIVNTRTPKIVAIGDIRPGEVRLKAPRETAREAWAWDNRRTLEFGNSRPTVCVVEIAKVEVPTVFLLGDSTVCDQPQEPYASWGQMLTRFFKPTVAVANHGESGESYNASLGRRRIDKIASLMKPGDYLLMQFGHNDHHNNYGSYELAKCVVQGIWDHKLDIAKNIVDDFKGFDPAHPDPLDAFGL